ncbi:hypothetical protein [Bradyrhizobium barranii]
MTARGLDPHFSAIVYCDQDPRIDEKRNTLQLTDELRRTIIDAPSMGRVYQFIETAIRQIVSPDKLIGHPRPLSLNE